MPSATSTSLVLVGPGAGAALDALDRYRNVRAAPLADRPDDAARRWLSTGTAPYVVHDRDPLAHVAAAWVEFYDDQATLGTLELEVDRAVSAFDAGETMPDYYVVAEPRELAPTWKHWWLGVLAAAAPSRVLLREEHTAWDLARTLRRLPSGRGWPEPSAWLSRVAYSVPDRVGLEPPA